MNYGKRISKIRQSKNITQKELASKLYVTDKTISSWESNRTEPSLEMIIKLSEILECSASYLLYGDNSKDNIEMEIKIFIFHFQKIIQIIYSWISSQYFKTG